MFPEDLADETINRVIFKIGAETVENKMAFVYGFAKNVRLESLRKEKRHQNIDEINIVAVKAEEEDFSHACLDKCLSELWIDDRRLILDYFSEEKQAKINLHKEIAERLQTTRVALRMRIMRIKQKLRVCLKQCSAA